MNIIRSSVNEKRRMKPYEYHYEFVSIEHSKCYSSQAILIPKCALYVQKRKLLILSKAIAIGLFRMS
eukprot:Pgem_evm1s11785